MPSFVRFSQRPVLAACLVALAVLALPVVGLAQSAPAKIAVVSLDYVVANSEMGKALQQKLEQFRSGIRAEIDEKAAAARTIRQQLAAGSNSLSESKLIALQKELEDLGIQDKRFRDDKQREGEKLQREGLQEIEAALEPVMTAIRDEAGYDLILNNVPGSVVMTSERLDITLEVIERLNASSSD